MRLWPLVAAGLCLCVVACEQATPPAGPGGLGDPSNGAGPGGITLKIAAPTLMSPANGTTVTSTSSVAFVVGRLVGLNTSFPVTFEFDIAKQGSSQLDNTKMSQAFSGNSTYTMNRQLDINATYTWRVRGIYSGAAGPWSDTFTFRTPDIPPGYVLASEIFDPLTDGKTAGGIVGGVTLIPGVGAQILSQSSFIRYTLTTPLQAGEISLMVTNYDGTSPGDKSKVFAMQQGDDNITANAYRMTAEMRGSNYADPGTVAYRIIFGDGDSRDGERQQLSFSKTRWYFWRFTWRTGGATLQVRADGPTGPVLYDQSVTGASPYRPQPHRVYIGSPVGSNGPIDASLAGMIVKNLWVSAGPRPTFPSAGDR